MSTASPIRVQCSNCGNGYKVKSEAAGRMVKCPKCGTKNEVKVDGRLEERLPMAIPEPDEAASDELQLSPFDFPGSDSKTFSAEDFNSFPTLENTPPPPPKPEIRFQRPSHQRPIASSDEYVPRRYLFLEIVRGALFIVAGLIGLAWIGATLLFFTGMFAVNTEPTPEPTWPYGVPAGANAWDSELTDTQRSALLEYERDLTRHNSTTIAAGAQTAAKGMMFMVWLGSIIPTLITTVLLCAIAELIRVGLDIQRNTQFTAYMSR